MTMGIICSWTGYLGGWVHVVVAASYEQPEGITEPLVEGNLDPLENIPVSLSS